MISGEVDFRLYAFNCASTILAASHFISKFAIWKALMIGSNADEVDDINRWIAWDVTRSANYWPFQVDEWMNGWMGSCLSLVVHWMSWVFFFFVCFSVFFAQLGGNCASGGQLWCYGMNLFRYLIVILLDITGHKLGYNQELLAFIASYTSSNIRDSSSLKALFFLPNQ